MRIQLNYTKFLEPEPYLEGDGVKEDIFERMMTPQQKEMINRVQANTDKRLADYNLTRVASYMVYSTFNKRAPLRGSIGDFEYLPKLSTDEVAVWVNNNSKEIMIAFRGSSTDYDWKVTDIALATGFLKTTERYKNNLELANKAHNSYRGFSIIFTGQSLGGALAHYIYEDFKRRNIKSRLIMFNRGSSAVDPLIKLVGDIDKNKIHYSFHGDVYSRAFLRDKSTKHYVSESPDPKETHSIKLFKKK